VAFLGATAVAMVATSATLLRLGAD
jgi:hypothetical protein